MSNQAPESPADELLALSLDLRAWVELHGREFARPGTEREDPLPLTNHSESATGTPASPSRGPDPVSDVAPATLRQFDWTGPEDAELVFIRQHSTNSAAEDLFERILHNVLGLRRSEVRVCSVTEPDSGSTVLQLPQAITVELHRPERILIIALGQKVCSLLSGGGDLARLRGAVHSYGGVALLYSHDASHLLVNSQDKRAVFEDMKLLRRKYAQITGRELPSPAGERRR
ncbi:MAG: hypothetical protein CMP23_07735 [Rickettsiales bacterium]|nr:hypothetical protein [Rickettsiales bacterium]